MASEPIDGGDKPDRVAAQILDQLPVAVVVVDPSGDVFYSNRASDALLRPGAAGGFSAADLGHVHSRGGGTDRPEASLPLGRALAGERLVVEDMEVEQPIGDPLAVEVVASPIVGDEEEVVLAAEVLWDIRPHRAGDSASALLKAIVSSTDDAIISTDRHGLITSWNSGAEHLYGYAAEEMMGRPLSTIVLPGEAPIPSLEQVLSGAVPVHLEAQRRRKDGSVVRVAKSLSVLSGPGGQAQGLVHVTRDVSEEVEVKQALARAQREVEARNQRLERSNRDLEQFAYIASHDLSEPLRAVAGMVSLLSRRYKGRLDDDADEFITFAVEGCERMRAMIEDLLKFSRAGRVELHLQEVEIAEVVEAVIGDLWPQIDDAEATVTTGDLPAVQADATQLSQVFQNLISNAIKFRQPDVPITVRVSASSVGHSWRFEIADNGIGIDEAYRERIFRMFQRLHPTETYEGTGIGLAISERIIERHGGAMGVEETPGGGSTFWFTVPEAPQEAA